MTPHSPSHLVSLSLLALWERQVAARPDSAAVEFGPLSLTYAELDRRSDRLAGWLSERGVGANDAVGICLERSLDVPVAVLAVLKAGAAYLPLDPRYPSDRLAFMLADGDVRALLTHRSLKGLLSFNSDRTLYLDDETLPAELRYSLESPARTDDLLAYVIYTSGSTGRPKGVALGRAALANLIRWQIGSSSADAGSRTLQFTPLSFDVHFQELFGTWAPGGTLVLVADEIRLDPAPAAVS